MPTPAAFLKVRQDQAAEAARQEIRRQQQEEFERRMADAEYNSICNHVREYDGAFLDGLEVTIKKHPKKKRVEFFIEDEHWLTFSVKRNYRTCNCESYCNCEPEISYSIETTKPKDGKDTYCSFWGFGTDASFASAIAAEIDEYKKR